MTLRRARLLTVLILAINSIIERQALAQPAGAHPSVQSTASLQSGRHSHTATLLPNGKVLVAGGGGFPCEDSLCFSTTNNTAELYDPATGSWRSTGIFSRRGFHSATLLRNGLVLVVGGWDWGLDINTPRFLNSAELYDPVAEVWRPTQSPIAIVGQ